MVVLREKETGRESRYAHSNAALFASGWDVRHFEIKHYIGTLVGAPDGYPNLAKYRSTDPADPWDPAECRSGIPPEGLEPPNDTRPPR